MHSPYYQDDRIALYCGDYAEILPQIASESVDLVLTDPPFGIGHQSNFTYEKLDVLENDGEVFSYKILFDEANRILNSKGCCFAYTSWKTFSKHYEELPKGMSRNEPLIIQKRESGAGSLSKTFRSNSDWIIFSSKEDFCFQQTTLLRNIEHTCNYKKPVIMPEYKTRFPSCWFGKDYPQSTAHSSHYHPTVKTVLCMEWLVQITTDSSALVVDPFMGTGTTIVAADKLGRRAIGIEIEEQFCEVALHRLTMERKYAK